MISGSRGVLFAKELVMPVQGTPRPSILGCAVGFAAIGSGIGAVIGLVLASLELSSFPEADRPAVGTSSFFYGWVYPGTYIGFALGGVAGVVYALVRRRRYGHSRADRISG
jgi:hypothetical protein